MQKYCTLLHEHSKDLAQPAQTCRLSQIFAVLDMKSAMTQCFWMTLTVIRVFEWAVLSEFCWDFFFVKHLWQDVVQWHRKANFGIVLNLKGEDQTAHLCSAEGLLSLVIIHRKQRIWKLFMDNWSHDVLVWFFGSCFLRLCFLWSV